MITISKKIVTLNFVVIFLLVIICTFLIRQNILYRNNISYKVKIESNTRKKGQEERQIKEIYDQIAMESDLPAVKKALNDFFDEIPDQLKIGSKNIKKHKAVFVGISRDNVQDINGSIETIEKLGELFKDYRVIVVENDSKDGTRERLQDWSSKNSRVNTIFKDFNIKKRPSIKFMADVRNLYLEELINKKYNDFDIVVVIDMDMKYPIDPRGVFDSFNKVNEWDVVASHGLQDSTFVMYDLFAAKGNGIIEKRWHEYSNFNEFCFDNWIGKNKRIIFPGRKMIKVESAFNGMAIYKRKFIKNCKYDSINEDCEHVLFHECLMNNGARIFLNPSQVILYSHFPKSYTYNVKEQMAASKLNLS